MTVSKVYTEGNVPLKVWASALEEGALTQAQHLTQLPFAFHHAAVMPDGHQGYGMPIGGVLATKGVIVPYAVGVDIGCGVRAWKTGVTVEEFREKQDAIMPTIVNTIPVGFKHHAVRQLDWFHTDDLIKTMPSSSEIPVVNEEYGNSLFQLGTLGGGNHFIEVQADENDNVWVMVHSGSRNLGKKVCDHYNKVAEKLNAKWHSAVPKEWQLAFLPADSTEGHQYLTELALCLQFAKQNRNHMMQAIDLIFMDNGLNRTTPIDYIDVHHNYVAIEHHFGADVWVHRKGAVKAVGTVLIPGSMGSASYVAKGLEAPESFKSCSHGAGRAMSRKAAMRDLSLTTMAMEMQERDIDVYVGDGDFSEVLAESREAYHDIDEVMANQSDLVRIGTKLRPLAVVKDAKEDKRKKRKK